MCIRHDEFLCRITSLEIQLLAKDKKIEELSKTKSKEPIKLAPKETTVKAVKP